MAVQPNDNLYGYIHGTRDEVDSWYKYCAKQIEDCDKEAVKSLYKAHVDCIESTSMKRCHKTARRKRIIALWLDNSSDTLALVKEVSKDG